MVRLMVNVFIFYDSKYGNTKLAAEKVAEGLRDEAVVVDLGYIKEVSAEHAADYDGVVLGAPNHMGRPSQAMKNFINQLATAGLQGKKVAVFGTYAGKERHDRAVTKLEKMVQRKLAGATLVSPGLSVRVNGVSGPVVDGELPKCVNWGRALVAQL